MTRAASKLLEEFEALPEQDRSEFLAELVRRAALAPHDLPADVMTCGINQTGNVSFPAGNWSNGGRTQHSSQYGGTHLKRDMPRYVRLIERGLYNAKALVTRPARPSRPSPTAPP